MGPFAGRLMAGFREGEWLGARPGYQNRLNPKLHPKFATENPARDALRELRLGLSLPIVPAKPPNR
jgi:hypothetical protein